MATSFKETEIKEANFSVTFQKDFGATSGDINLQPDSDFNKLSLPGAAVRFFLFAQSISDLTLQSTLGNITFLGMKTLEQTEIVSVTSSGNLSTQYNIADLGPVSIIGKSYNYGGIEMTEKGYYLVKKADEAIDYVVATLSVTYTAIAEHYELTHTKPKTNSNKYDISILALGVNTL